MSAKIRASHILVSTDSRKKDVALTEIEALHKKITDGADFGEVARDASDCPSGSRGGDLGQFGRGAMVPEFEEAAFDLEVNAMSGVVETDFERRLTALGRGRIDLGNHDPADAVGERMIATAPASVDASADDDGSNRVHGSPV